MLQIFDKIQQETGWRVEFIHKELKEKWGWNNERLERSDDISDKSSELAMFTQRHESQQQHQQAQQQKLAAAVMQQATRDSLQQQKEQQAAQKSEETPYGYQSFQAEHQGRPSATLCRLNHRRVAGILNPMLASADFSMPQHPYQSHYVAPNAPNTAPQFPY